MADERKNGSSRGTVLTLFLAFVILFLVVRISAVREARDEALDACEAHRRAEQERVKERDRALEAQGRAIAQADAQLGRIRTLQGIIKAETAKQAQVTSDHAAAVAALKDEMGRLRRERDVAATNGLDFEDRHAALETVLVKREAELAKMREDLRKALNPTEADRAAMLVGSKDARVRAIGIEKLAGLRAEPGVPVMLRLALLASESEAEALSVLRAAGDPDSVSSVGPEAQSVFVRRAVARVTGDRARLVGLLRDADAPTRAAAAARMGALREKASVVPLREASKDADVTVRSAVALALAQLGDWEGVTPLLADKDVRVARCALAGFVAGGKALPKDVEVHPDLASAVALSRRLLSERSDSD